MSLDLASVKLWLSWVLTMSENWSGRYVYNLIETRPKIIAMKTQSVGALPSNLQNSGIDGPGGWVPNNNAFVNQYYGGLVGRNAQQGESNQQLVATSPPWRTFFLDNTGITTNQTGTVVAVPSRNYWTLQPPGSNRVTIMVGVQGRQTLSRINRHRAHTDFYDL